MNIIFIILEISPLVGLLIFLLILYIKRKKQKEKTKIICPVCKESKMKSKSFLIYANTTLLAVEHGYNENGEYFRDDPNTRDEHYRCSNGHEFYVEFKNNKLIGIFKDENISN